MTRTRVAHALLILVGLLVLVYPLSIGAASEVTCRGVVMRAGDQCTKADGSGVQTYEQRANARDNARPVIVVVGALVAAFGTTLLVTDLRRRPVTT